MKNVWMMALVAMLGLSNVSFANEAEEQKDVAEVEAPAEVEADADATADAAE